LLRAGDYCDLETIYPLADIRKAFEAVRQRRAIKAIVRISEG
jgi:hypothetical protein